MREKSIYSGQRKTCMMANIPIPSRINDDFGDGLNKFFWVMGKIRAFPKGEVIELDMTKCVFLNPLFLLPLMMLVKEENKIRQITIRRDGTYEGFNNYLNFIYFTDGLQPENIPDSNYKAFLSLYKSKTYVPIINFPAGRIKNETEIRDNFMGILNKVLTDQ